MSMRSSRPHRPPMAASTTSTTAGGSTRHGCTRFWSGSSAPVSWCSISPATILIPADAARGRGRSWRSGGAPRGAPARGPVAAPPATADGKATGGFRDVWYGFYPNGREVLFGVETAHGDDLSAVYAIGPSVDNKHPAAWTRRKGRVIEDSFVFEEKG